MRIDAAAARAVKGLHLRVSIQGGGRLPRRQRLRAPPVGSRLEGFAWAAYRSCARWLTRTLLGPNHAPPSVLIRGTNAGRWSEGCGSQRIPADYSSEPGGAGGSENPGVGGSIPSPPRIPSHYGPLVWVSAPGGRTPRMALTGSPDLLILPPDFDEANCPIPERCDDASSGPRTTFPSPH